MDMARFNRRSLVPALVILLLAGLFVAAPASGSNGNVTNAEREALCLDFVQNHMLTAQGGVRTNYLDTDEQADVATGAQVLSESVGLWMEYAVSVGDTGTLQRTLAFVRQYLDTGEILSYRYSPLTGAYPVNALIDDFRIIRALLTADGLPGARETALAYAARLYGTNVKNGYLFDLYDTTYAETNDSITLCYLDFPTLQLLAQKDTAWAPVEQTMLEIAESGYLGDDFPLYANAYGYALQAYDTEDIQTVQSLLTVYHLLQIGACPQRTLDYLRRNVESGALYGAYHRSGTPASTVQSTAIYALCARIFNAAGDADTCRLCLSRMNEFQVLDINSEVFGAFADAKTKQGYAFDNLMALLAYRQEP